MKKGIALLLLVAILGGFAACRQTPADPTPDDTPTVTDTVTPTPETQNTDIAFTNEWVRTKIEENAFFSFRYDGKAFDTFIDTWEKNVESKTAKNGDTTFTVTYSNGSVEVTATVLVYASHPAVDWVCEFTNRGAVDTAPISDIQALDATVEVTNAQLLYAYGGNSDGQDFEPLTRDFSGKYAKYFALTNRGGRSSDGYMPYYNLYGDNGGVVVAIGWTGQWSATFAYSENQMHLTAGMTKTDIALHPQESMRTPSIVMTFFSGDHELGQNAFRRLVLDSYTPTDEHNEPIRTLPLTLNMWGSGGEAALLSGVEAANAARWPFEVLWVDAGWHGNHASADTYDMTWYNEAGNWYVNEAIYPNGLEPVADRLHEEGQGLLLWFEPERVVRGSEIDQNHPSFVMRGSSSATLQLYNLADDDATDFLIDLIGTLIQENGIDWYRQDFNCEPLDIWKYQDSLQGEHRTGITEIRYITNLYRYLDGLIEMNPGLLIDNCASGGRRLDIEMSKRSVPLWRSDYYVTQSSVPTNSDTARSIAWNLSLWVPLSCGGSTADGIDNSYEFRSQMGAGMTMWYYDAANDSFWQNKLEEYFTCRAMMTGDYYILGEGTGKRVNAVNAAYEYFVPEEGRGFIVAFRPFYSTEADTLYTLKGLNPAATYRLTVADSGETMVVTGSELLARGLNIHMETKRSSVLIYIDETNGQ